MFLKNVWYVAAEPREITRKPFPRTICGEPIVFWRTEDGAPVALEDRCCHRRMPLRKGVLVEDRLQCFYHGLEFDRTGQCVHVPGQTTIPPGTAVRAYPVVERYDWLWIWMGDPALADESMIVPYPWKTSDEWGCKGSYFHVNANYQLIIDNLLDLSHLAFVHQSTIGNAPVAEAADSRVFRDDDKVTVARWIVQQEPPPIYINVGGFTPGVKVDRWQIIEWKPPGFVRLSTGGALGAADGKEFGFRDLEHKTPPGAFALRNLNAITPETETSCHYFWAQAHNIMPITEQMTDTVFRQIVTAFNQDWEVFEMQQANWDDRAVIDINADGGPIAARQMTERLMAAEAARQSAAVAAE